jgi:Flp pilus assembly protein TadG
MISRSCQSLTDRRGAVITEFAICAPVFFLIVLTMFEFGWLNVVRHTADNAAYEASRVSMVPGATAAEAIAEAERIMSVIGTRGATVEVNPSVLAPETTQVTVTVRVPLDRNSMVIPKFGRGKEIESSSTLRTERVETR